MNFIILLIAALFPMSGSATPYSCQTSEEVTLNGKSQKPRVLISTDIGGTDPDDNQSMLLSW